MATKIQAPPPPSVVAAQKIAVLKAAPPATTISALQKQVSDLTAVVEYLLSRKGV